MAGYATTLAPFVVLRVEYLSILSGWLAGLRTARFAAPLSLSSAAVCALALARSLTAVAMAANGTNILFPSSARHAKKRKILCTALVRRRWS